MSTTPFPLPIMLDAADRKALRARAHRLDPVIMIGEAGLTRAVLDETDRALRAHELIKVRVLGDDRTQRQAMSTEICSALGCTTVQSIGKLLVLYRPRPIEDHARDDEPHVPKKRVAQGATTRAKKPAVSRHRPRNASEPATSRATRTGAGTARSTGTRTGATGTRSSATGKRTGATGTRTSATAKRTAETGARTNAAAKRTTAAGPRAAAKRAPGARPAAKRTAAAPAVRGGRTATGKDTKRDARGARAPGRAKKG